jgi:dTDP-4-dehydrorhamnose 3,5-epimerase
MEIKELDITGVYEIGFEPRWDERGFFMRTYDVKEFEAKGLNKKWVQENQSLSKKKGIIRGLHFQLPPFAETKLVRCIRGAVFDICVDLRAGSATFGCWTGIELSESNYKSLYIPRGFAHGFCTLTDNCAVQYKVDNYYSPGHEAALVWNDAELNINWPVDEVFVSQKDRDASTFSRFKEKYPSGILITD